MYVWWLRQESQESDGGFGSDGVDRSVAREDAYSSLFVTPSLLDFHSLRPAHGRIDIRHECCRRLVA